MYQGTYIIKNVEDDLYVEVNHGPFLVDKESAKQNRFTPFHNAHSTKIAGHSNIEGGDDRYYNNIFVARKDYKKMLTYNEQKCIVQSKHNDVAM